MNFSLNGIKIESKVLNSLGESRACIITIEKTQKGKGERGLKKSYL
jgi:hypothetical protein